MNELYQKENKSASRAMEVLGTIAFGTVAASAVSSGNGGGGFLGNLFGNGCAWSDREVMLQRQIDAVNANQMVTAAVTPYQIREATCDMVRAKKYIPEREIVYTTPDNRCGYNGGCI